MDSSNVTPSQEAKLHFLDYWRILRIRKTVVLAVFFLVLATATLVTFMLPESFSASARIKIERDAPDVSGPGGGGGVASGYDPYFIQTEFEIMQSERVLGKVIEQLNLNQIWGNKFQNGMRLKNSESIDLLKKVMDLRPVRNTSLVEIRVFSDHAEDNASRPNDGPCAATLANVIAEVYKADRLDQYLERTRRGVKALEQNMSDLETNVTTAQKKVDDLRTALKINDPDPMSMTPTPQLSADMLRQLNTTLMLLETEQARNEVQLSKLLELKLEQQRAAIQTAIGGDAELGTLLNELDLAQQKVLSLEKDYAGTENPTYLNAKAMVVEQDKKIDSRVNGILLGLKNKVDSGNAQVVNLRRKLEEAKKRDLELAESSRPYFEAKAKLNELVAYRQILAMKIAADNTELTIPKSAMVVIEDHAVPNLKPVRPNKPLNIALGVVIGLVVGVGLAFFIEYLDTSVKTIEDVERTLQVPVLGVVPQNVGFLIDDGAESPHAEAYRVLRTNLLFSRKDDKLNTVAVVSAGAGEGKSTTIFNLATVFAQNGSRVLLVDSDLRRPTLHKMLRISNSLGLTNYLLKQNTLEEVIQTTALPTLDIMASGKLPSSSFGILSSVHMNALIKELKTRYDFVFFDSPPIMGVSDASVLASEADMTIQVIQYRRYPQPMNIRAKQMIEKVGGNLIGIVLNNINVAQDENYYYYSGYSEYYAKSDEAVEVRSPEKSAEKGADKPAGKA
jgi:Mrp family chromosome partitioning ATPase